MNKKSNYIIIAIDGLSASGKGTIAQMLAKRLNLEYFSTGNIYRALAYLVMQNNILESDIKQVIKLAQSLSIEGVKNIIQNYDLNTKELSSKSSIVSAIPEVRDALFKMQRDLPSYKTENKNGMILDGRDIGTIIFPDADYKFFIKATLKERALRRFNQLQKENNSVIYEDVIQDLYIRDKRDSTREIAPMVPASDAHIIDTTKMRPEEAVEHIVKILK